MADIPVYVTLLPNGGTPAGGLKFSVVLTPSLPTSVSVPLLLQNWPVNSAPLYNGPWTLSFNNNPVAAPQNLNPARKLDATYWNALVDGKLPVVKRQHSQKFKDAWFVSPKAPSLHARHTQFRTAHVVKQLLNNADADEDLGNDWDGYVDSLSPRLIYIFPAIQKDKKVRMADLLNDRQLALSTFNSITDPAIRKRIAHGQKKLEDEEGEQLTGMALLALYHHCVTSFQRPVPDPFVTAINASVANLAVKDPDPNIFTQVEHYVSYHLFKSRSHHVCQPQPTPDFHQTLGLLQKYPALMRKLGLVLDFDNVILPPGFNNAGAQTISIAAPMIAGFTFTPMVTQYANLSPFAMASRNAVHVDRCLALDSNFQLVTEDADGSAQKLSQQKTAAARQSEYQTTPPPSSGIDAPDPSAALPSSRTAGLALYHDDRAKSVAELIRSAPDINNLTAPLYLEDVNLGYRVDVKVSADSPWTSLHKRDSKYFIDGIKDSYTPTPNTIDELADEGYIGLAATHSDVPDSNGDTQVKLHESVVTWTGWSLSVPRPGSSKVEDTFNGKPGTTCPTPDKPNLHVTPAYAVRKGTHLPKLRFGSTYSMRLRHVDLAGNSIAEADPVSAKAVITQDKPFSRHEPIRAPQILLEHRLDHVRSPSEHADRLVLRDMSAQTTRMLVPPREPLRMAELYDLIKSSTLPTSAFSTFEPKYALLPNGAFPRVIDVSDKLVSPYKGKTPPTPEDHDAIIVRRGDNSLPTNPFLPDPAARVIRIDPAVLQEDLVTYSPWLSDGDASPDKCSHSTYFAHALPFHPWPDVSPVRILVRSVAANKPLRICLELISEAMNATLPTIPTLSVDLPQACTVALQLSCVSGAPTDAPPQSVQLLTAAGTPSGPTATPAPKTVPDNFFLHMFHEVRDLFKPAPGPLNAALAPSPNQPKSFASAPPPKADLLKNVSSTIGDVKAITFSDGTTTLASPRRSLTLVHALKTPLLEPEFATVSDKIQFTVLRLVGQNSASITGLVSAHWLSTGKVRCAATWTDQVDDPSKPDKMTRTVNEIAFEFANKGGTETSHKWLATSRDLAAQHLQHLFRDSRAHSVTYTLSAYTRFSEYYPENPKAPQAGSLIGSDKYPVEVLSSVRPPAPSIPYVLPAFAWKDVYTAATKTWQRGRTIVIRVYLERPFLVSGDKECLGVVLAPSSGKATGATVTQWGADPIVSGQPSITSNFMTRANFICADADVFHDCTSFGNTGPVDVVVFPVEFSPERSLWFCDIALNTSQTASAFVRFALVRWQPSALNTTDDCRLSQFELADFMQIGSDRWVSVKKVSPTRFSVCISGVFRKPGGIASPMPESQYHTVSCSIEQRWHRLGTDLGWRPVCPGPIFTPKPNNGDNVTQWEANIDLPYSTTLYKFRLLLEEREWFQSDVSKLNTDPIPTKMTPKSRLTYLHYIEL
jgi:hypothetical protein